MYKLFLMLLPGLYLLAGCGKPNEAESIIKKDNTGGYKIVNRFVTSGYAQDVLIKDNLAYIAQGEGGLMIIDIADPENPEIVSLTTEGARGYSTKIAMKDSAVYLAAGTSDINVINVSDPNEPLVLPTHLSSIVPAQSMYIYEDYMFTAISSLGVNISKLGNPEFNPIIPVSLYNISSPGFAQSLTTIDSTFLLVACGEMGLSIFDTIDFQGGWPNYHLVGWFNTPGYAESITISKNDSIAFMACGTAGLQIIDFSDTTNMHIVGSYDGGGYAKDLIFRNNKIFMTAELGGLQIIDVSNVNNPSLIGKVDTEYALGLDIDDNYIYVADEDEGLIIISIPD